MEQQITETSGGNSNQMVDYMLHSTPNSHHHEHHQEPEPYVTSSFCSSTSLDKLNFQDVMQFADFGPKLALNQTKKPEEANGIDPIYFLKFPVLNDHHFEQEQEQEENVMGEDERFTENTSGQLRFLGENFEKGPLNEVKNKRKRTRSVKTSEEVENQRMTHIAVERNRRKQMNEHLRVLRSLMPGSYVQRGDQASIIGGAIEFVRELEQLLQCLESQKRRRLHGDSINTSSVGAAQGLVDQQPPPPFFLATDDQLEGGLLEETAESKSCIADVEVKLLGFDAIIKILSRRRPGQLIKAIAALEDLQLNIIHTNITTIDQTVLYSFTVKVGGEARVTAEDIANSVQQIFTFIHAYNNM